MRIGESQIVLALAVLAAGCNSLLGLDRTQAVPIADAPPPTDDDHDDVRDDVDNCPTIANADQADGDDDDIGDACDQCEACVPCAVGPHHDDDGDRLADGCDNCPAQANAGQQNADGDDLGDACDLDAGSVQRRVFFDGFGTLDAGWAGNTVWVATARGVQPLPGQVPTFDGFRLANLGVTVAAGAFRVDVGIDLPALPPPGKLVGFRMITPQSPSSFWFCAFSAQESGWAVTSGNMVATTATGVTALRNRGNGAMPEQNLCEVPGDAQATTTSSYEPRPWSPQLWTTVDAAYRYIDVIQ